MLVIATVCFIFLVAAGYNLPDRGKFRELYDSKGGKLLIEQKGSSISIRSKQPVDIMPGPVATLFE